VDIYQVPLVFQDEGVDDYILEHFGLTAPEPELSGWQRITERAKDASGTVRIALVGKYVKLEDAYLSVVEALRHAGVHHGVRVEIEWVDSERVADSEVRRTLGR